MMIIGEDTNYLTVFKVHIFYKRLDPANPDFPNDQPGRPVRYWMWHPSPKLRKIILLPSRINPINNDHIQLTDNF